jgi:hypothetical protein
MTRNQMFVEGRDLWHEYVRVNGYSFEPKIQGIKKLSRLLDLKQCYIRKCINTYLEV